MHRKILVYLPARAKRAQEESDFRLK